jgi:tripartite-type tricarboxylate transporter receptor subunit TctC
MQILASKTNDPSKLCRAKISVIAHSMGNYVMQKALAVTSRERSAFLPEVPALAQALPGFEVTSFLGLAGPPGMPRPVVERLNAEIRKVLAEHPVPVQSKN